MTGKKRFFAGFSDSRLRKNDRKAMPQNERIGRSLDAFGFKPQRGMTQLLNEETEVSHTAIMTEKRRHRMTLYLNKKPAKSLSQARLFKAKRDFVKIFSKICIFHLQTAEKYVRFKMLKHIIHCLITITIINENVFYSNLWVKSFRWILLFLIRRLYTLSGHDMVGLSTVLHWYGFQPLSTLSNFSIIEMMQHL